MREGYSAVGHYDTQPLPCEHFLCHRITLTTAYSNTARICQLALVIRLHQHPGGGPCGRQLFESGSAADAGKQMTNDGKTVVSAAVLQVQIKPLLCSSRP